MSRRRNLTSRQFGLVAVISLIVMFAAMVISTAGAQADDPLNPRQFRGINWADPRDNFANDEVVPSGLLKTDDYETSYAKGTAIGNSFKSLGFNTVRLPVNPYSVGADNAWWASYKGAIDALTDLKMNVQLSYWEGTDAAKNGMVDNPTTWWQMWNQIVDDYLDNPRIYFSVMNEPFGYSSTAWANLAAQWLDTYPMVPRNRVFIAGHLYSENMSVVCYDSRLNGTYLALHNYAFWNTYNYNQWMNDHNNRLAGCTGRVVYEEFGVPMNSALDFNSDPTGGMSSSNQNYVNFLRSTTEFIRTNQMGSIYWPGLRTGDSYSLTNLAGSGTNLSLNVINQSGLDRLRYSWGPDIDPPVTTHQLSPAAPNGENGWYVSPIVMTLDAEDDGANSGGVANTYFRFGDAPNVGYINPVNIGFPGEYTVRYHSVDADGNTETDKSFDVKIDMDTPESTAQVTGKQDGDVFVDEAVVSISATDATSGVDRIEFAINGGGFDTYNGAFAFGLSGTHTIYFRAIDIAGNVEEIQSVTFTVVDPPALGLKVKKKAKVGKKKKSVKVTVTVRNTGEATATDTKVCVKTPGKVSAKKKCVTTGTIAGGGKAKAVFTLKVKKKYKGTKTVKFTATGADPGSVVGKLKLKR